MDNVNPFSTTPASPTNYDIWANGFPTKTTQNTTVEPELTYFWEYKASLLVQAYAGIIILLVGIIGNSLCIVTLSQRFQFSSTSIYLVNLAVADLTACVIGQVFRVLPRSISRVDPALFNPLLCKSWFFINHSAKTISGWTLVAVTVERALVVYLPLHAKRICTTKRAKITIILINILCSVIYLHYFWSYGPVYVDEVLTAGCTINTTNPPLLWYMINIRPWQDFIIRSVAPSTCLLICNILIIGKLIKEHHKRKQMSDSKDSKMTSLTVMLLTVSFAHLICVSPMQIMYLIDKSDPFGRAIHYRWQAIVALRWAFAIDLYYANHAINFVLYFICGSQFRESLRHMLVGLPCLRRCYSEPPSLGGISNQINTHSVNTLSVSTISLAQSTRSIQI